jgi:hypothetical protein
VKLSGCTRARVSLSVRTKGANGRKARMRAARAGPRYGAAHIFLTSHAPDAALSPLRDAPGLAPRLRTLKEFNLEFLAVESQVRLPPVHPPSPPPPLPPVLTGRVSSRPPN